MSSFVNGVISVSGLWTCFVLYGICQEQLKQKQFDGTKFSFTAMLMFAQAISCVVAAFFGTIYEKSVGTKKTLSWVQGLGRTDVFITGAMTILATYTSTEALDYVNQPTQILVKVW